MAETDWLLIEIASETLFRDQAINALDEFWRERNLDVLTREQDWPVRRNQLSTIRQISRRQPSKMTAFAKHQQARAEAKAENSKKKHKIEDEIAFWELLARMCNSPGRNEKRWSLENHAKTMVPAALRDPFAGQTKSQLSIEQKQQRKALKKDRNGWICDWDKRAYPAFFQHFCAHYLYLATRTDPA